MASRKTVPVDGVLSPTERESYYLPSEVAEMFGVTARTVANWCDRGVLDAIVTPTGQRRIRASSIKGGREYDAKKAAFVEHMARRRGGSPAPDQATVVDAVLRGRREDELPTVPIAKTIVPAEPHHSKMTTRRK